MKADAKALNDTDSLLINSSISNQVDLRKPKRLLPNTPLTTFINDTKLSNPTENIVYGTSTINAINSKRELILDLLFLLFSIQIK
jgi:hypothetical protein